MLGMVDDRDDLNISKLKDMAIDAECDSDFDRALQLWEQVNLSATKLDDQRRALNKVRDLMSRVNPVVKPIVPEVQTTSEVPLGKGDLGGSNLSWKEMTFEFETAKVNDRGEVVDRRTLSRRCFRQDLGKGVFIDMVEIPAGKFQGTNVESFLMSKTPITQAQWEAIFKLKQISVELKSNSWFEGVNRPVERVNWWQAEEFCKRLSIVTQHDYRLPSEAQWEYACRSDTTTEFYFGDKLTKEVANFGRSMRVKGTTDVEKYPANAWGLYDMHGNVWEWCADHWRSSPETPLKDSNPYLSSENNAHRVLRGGSWFRDSSCCRSAYRDYDSPSVELYGGCDLIGLRLVCSSTTQLKLPLTRGD